MSTENGQTLMSFVDLPSTDGGDSDSWCTPPEIVDVLHRFWPRGIDLDPCSNQYSTVPARTRWTIEDDGLARPWDTYAAVYCNPPYSAPRPWAAKCLHHGSPGDDREAVMLIKGDWSVKWWRDFIWRADAVCLWAKRIAFVSQGRRVPGSNFPNAFAYFGRRRHDFADVFMPHGKVFEL